MAKIPEGSWLNAFTSPQAFRKMLIEEPHRINGLAENERQRLVDLSDEELKREMNSHLDLSGFFEQ